MENWEETSGRLTDAEDYFRFFEVAFDQRVVSVNRLHILKKFAEFREAIDREWPDGVDAGKKRDAYRAALAKSYETFLTRTAQDEKLFKVFREATGGINVVFHPEGLGTPTEGAGVAPKGSFGKNDREEEEKR